MGCPWYHCFTQKSSFDFRWCQTWCLTKVDSFLLLWGVFDDSHGDSFSVVSLCLSFSSLDLSGFSLFFELLLSDLFLLHLVDTFDEDSLVLELVTLWSKIEVMVNISVDLLGFSILSKKSSKNSLSTHPEDLWWHSGVSGTLSLTETWMSTYIYDKRIVRAYVFA